MAHHEPFPFPQEQREGFGDLQRSIAMIMFLALNCIAIAISGFLAFALFWPMALVHMRDRHPDILRSFGSPAFVSKTGLSWLLMRRYRQLQDGSLNGLATPAWLAAWCTIFALIAAGLLRLFA